MTSLQFMSTTYRFSSMSSFIFRWNSLFLHSYAHMVHSKLCHFWSLNFSHFFQPMIIFVKIKSVEFEEKAKNRKHTHKYTNACTNTIMHYDPYNGAYASKWIVSALNKQKCFYLLLAYFKIDEPNIQLTLE